MAISALRANHLSFEERLAPFWDVDVDIKKDCGFPDFIDSNEGSPEGIKSHLALAQEGAGVSTGTERMFFALLFALRCSLEIHGNKGSWKWVGVDINPRAKAYKDFNLLLFRISKTREEYLVLSEPVKEAPSLHARIEIIREKMAGCLTDRLERYYQKHLVDFASIYLKQDHSWRDSEYFKECHYHKNDIPFAQLQDCIKSGNIINVIGDINNLSFLGESGETVSVVDASNIHEYAILNFKFGSDCRPRIIITSQEDKKTTYFSFVYDPLTDEEGHEFDRLYQVIESCSWNVSPLWMSQIFSSFRQRSTFFEFECGSARCRKTLEKMRQYVANHVLITPGLPSYNMTPWNICKLNDATPQQLQILSNQIDAKRFVKRLVNSWTELNPPVYLAFSKIEGWKEAFETYFGNPSEHLSELSTLRRLEEESHNLNELLSCLDQNNLLEGFTQEFGKERLEVLKEKHRVSASTV